MTEQVDVTIKFADGTIDRIFRLPKKRAAYVFSELRKMEARQAIDAMREERDAEIAKFYGEEQSWG